MRVLYILLFISVFQPKKPPIEELPCFLLMYEYILEQTTHVIYANVVNENGDLDVLETWFGENVPEQIYFEEFSKAGDFCGFAPSGKISDWEVVIFLVDRPGRKMLEPFVWYDNDEPFDIEKYWNRNNKGCLLGISTVWIKDGIAYTQTQPDFELILTKWTTLSNFKKDVLKDLLKHELLKN